MLFFRPRLNILIFLVSMDVTSLYTNIPQEKGIETVCNAYDSIYEGEFPIQTQYLKRALELIQENSFQFTEKTTSYLMEQPWVLKWQSLSPTSLWER